MSDVAHPSFFELVLRVMMPAESFVKVICAGKPLVLFLWFANFALAFSEVPADNYEVQIPYRLITVVISLQFDPFVCSLPWQIEGLLFFYNNPFLLLLSTDFQFSLDLAELTGTYGMHDLYGSFVGDNHPLEKLLARLEKHVSSVNQINCATGCANVQHIENFEAELVRRVVFLECHSPIFSKLH